jgi:hypothetical protein
VVAVSFGQQLSRPSILPKMIQVMGNIYVASTSATGQFGNLWTNLTYMSLTLPVVMGTVPENLCTCVQPSVPIVTNVLSTSINLHTLKLVLNLNFQTSFTVTMIIMARSEVFVWRRYHDQTCII